MSSAGDCLPCGLTDISIDMDMFPLQSGQRARDGRLVARRRTAACRSRLCRRLTPMPGLVDIGSRLE